MEKEKILKEYALDTTQGLFITQHLDEIIVDNTGNYHGKMYLS